MLLLFVFLCGFLFNEIVRNSKDTQKAVFLSICWAIAMAGSFMMYYNGIV